MKKYIDKKTIFNILVDTKELIEDYILCGVGVRAEKDLATCMEYMNKLVALIDNKQATAREYANLRHKAEKLKWRYSH